MPNGDETPAREPKTSDVIKTLIELLLKDEEFKKSLGRHTTYLVLATVAVAAAELTIGLPLITLASTPFVGAVIVFLIAQVEDWVRSGKPKTIYYLCPNEKKFIRISWSSLPRYRKVKGCGDCGASLIKRCQRGKHYIVSPDFDNPEGAPPKIGVAAGFGLSDAFRQIPAVLVRESDN
ncbi:hypothetical protein HYR99_06935 [Candidatus Poribacteria bacterium]|nr:hypothetical protein [Candidatus Poribacteria bacterium]